MKAAIFTLWQTMSDCIERGIADRRNSARRPQRSSARTGAGPPAGASWTNAGKARDPLAPLDSVTLVAMAVNEENAAGGRVVTAPTNGAAGVVPAIAYYYLHHASDCEPSREAARACCATSSPLRPSASSTRRTPRISRRGGRLPGRGRRRLLHGRRWSGRRAGRQTTPPMEHAAEIAMEHNLGMTCDPIGGLVQIPCIERNGMGAVKAVNAARLAMNDTEDAQDLARPGDRDHVPHRHGHAVALQRNEPRRAGAEYYRVLKH